ncbi:MAG TPA: SGNH/GDSL hydrolase family protein [Conexibacter sp.]|nr:SGNH/GDSL hydrolase family protein [Conexibacter sp.]
MSGIRRLAVALAAAVCCTALVAPGASALVYPSSMAATGASATQAFDTCAEVGADCPQNSWATGTNPAVDSIYLRIEALNPAIAGHAYDDAVSGSNMAKLARQFEVAAEQAVEFVTVDMGSNDICAREEGAMTTVASFRASFEAAFEALLSRRPGTRIGVMSIQNIYALWRLEHTSRAAIETWNAHGVCQAMLANPTSTSRADEERRARVWQRALELDGVLASVCAAHANCRYDGGAVSEYVFEAADVNARDHFHPSIAGQATLARVEWEVPWEF